MKNSFLFCAACCGLLASHLAQGAGLAEPILVVFGSNGGEKTEYITGRYLTENKIWNKFSTTADNNATSFETVKYGDGHDATGIGISVAMPVSGAGGCVSSFGGDTSVLSQYVDPSLVSGVSNHNNGTSVTFTGLSAGTYTLRALGARGNNVFGSGATVYSISGEGVSCLNAHVLASANTEGVNAPVVDSGSYAITASTYRAGSTANMADNWALMEFTFTVGDEGSFTINASGGGGGNIAALMLVPEPATASLGLLGAFGLMLRRRRK